MTGFQAFKNYSDVSAFTALAKMGSLPLFARRKGANSLAFYKSSIRFLAKVVLPLPGSPLITAMNGQSR